MPDFKRFDYGVNFLELLPTNSPSNSSKGKRMMNVCKGGGILVMAAITKVVDVATKRVSFFISGNQRCQADKLMRRVYKVKL